MSSPSGTFSLSRRSGSGERLALARLDLTLRVGHGDRVPDAFGPSPWTATSTPAGQPRCAAPSPASVFVHHSDAGPAAAAAAGPARLARPFGHGRVAERGQGLLGDLEAPLAAAARR